MSKKVCGAQPSGRRKSATADLTAKRMRETTMSNKQKRQQEYDRMKHEGARSVGGKNVEPLNQTEGTPRHSGRPIPKPTRAADLTDEVSDLSGGRKA